MKVVLFALTGFGNGVLDVLLESGCQVGAVFTRVEKGSFPYYREKNIFRYAKERGVPVYAEINWTDIYRIINGISPDLLLVATYYRIIPQQIITMTPLAVNLHPSLLPKYRGATPCFWALFNKEKETGVTAHFLTEKPDAGDMLIQRKLAIRADEDERSLRKRLSQLSADVARELIWQIREDQLSPVPQEEAKATYCSKFNKESVRKRKGVVVVNLKKNQQWLTDYVFLRNKHLQALLSEKVDLAATKEWLRQNDVELYGIIDGGIFQGAVVIYIKENKGEGEVAFFTSNIGCGYGGRLLKITDVVAVERRLSKLCAWTRDNNVPAINVFRRNRYFLVKKTEKTYRGEKIKGYLFEKYKKGDRK